MKAFKIFIILTLSTIILASCTVHIHYPGSGITEYMTEGSDTEADSDAPDEIKETDEQVKESEKSPETTQKDIEQPEPKSETTATPVTEEKISETTSSDPEAYIPPIYLVDITSPISKNKTATVSIIGQADTEYSIEVYYATGKSSAKGLENKISSDVGAVSWSWKIGASLKPGSYKIIISGGGDTLETAIQVN